MQGEGISDGAAGEQLQEWQEAEAMPVPQGDAFTCAVCYEESDKSERAEMPCCFREGSSIQFCKRCVQVICRTGIQGRLGKCPSCSAWFTLDGETVVSAREAVGTCRCCLQDKELTDVARQLCEGCLLGQTFAFRYECSRCHRIQRIPHPMWRYQESPTQPGTVTWACHVGCGDYTRWCIVPEDAARCPPELCPESWGRREEWLEAVRERRRIEAARDPPPRPDEERGGASQCTTM